MRRNADLPWLDQHSRRWPLRVTRDERSRMQNSRIGAGYWVKTRFDPPSTVARECSSACERERSRS